MSTQEETLELSSNEDNLNLSSDTEQDSDNEDNGKALGLQQLVNPKLILKQHKDQGIIISIVEK